ncbi:MAG: hypothetical protein M3R15_15780 [Acidobacteriota bacterium]|nr:hypothetical protein [Acidobacteriota bacterium]
MNSPKKVVCSVALFLSLSGCSRPAATVEQRSNEPSQAGVSFVNTVWRVRESSSVAPGQLYVFLSEGTLVMASPNGKPVFGTWKYEGGALTMVEEGIAYKTDILKLSKDEFKIRSNNPGEPVEITLIPAEAAPLPK